MALEYCSVMPHQPHLQWVPPHLRDITRRAAFLIRSGKKEQLERRRHPWPRKIWEKESQRAFCLRRVLSLLIQRGFFLVQVCFRKWRGRDICRPRRSIMFHLQQQRACIPLILERNLL